MKHCTTQRRVIELVGLLQEDTITSEQVAELESLVLSNPVARKTYVELIHLRDDLRWMTGEIKSSIPENLFPILEELPFSLDMDITGNISDLLSSKTDEVDTTIPGGGIPLLDTIFGFLSSPFMFRAIFLVLIVAPLLMITWTLTHPDIPPMPVLATITRQTPDTSWKKGVSLSPGASLIRGNRIQLTQGIAEIKFKSGVLVLLNGCSSLVITGPNRAILEKGTLTACVPKRATGFTVKTNQSEFIDLGTEFGIRIKPDGQEEAKVFKGRVDMRIAKENGKEKTISLCTGEAVQRDRGDQPKRVPGNAISFQPIYPDDHIAIFNVISDTSGFTSKSPIRIDCVAGTVVPFAARASTSRIENFRPERNIYHSLSHLTSLDGVFVPDGKTKISSQDTYCDFRDTNGLSHSPLIINGPIRTGTFEGERYAILDNVDYSLPEHSFLAMYANKGITIDLNVFSASLSEA